MTDKLDSLPSVEVTPPPPRRLRFMNDFDNGGAIEEEVEVVEVVEVLEVSSAGR